ncbi:MAG: class I SAM-dependent methyltransferase [Candidatus Acidiferrum sp.]
MIKGQRIGGACPLCRHGSSLLFSLAHTTVWKCSAETCGLEFAFPQLDDADLSRAYTTLYYPDGVAEQNVRFENTSEGVLRQFFDQLSSRLGPGYGKRLLDYGCGHGRLLQIAKERGFQTTGIERDSVARRGAQEKSGSRVFAGIEELLMSDSNAEFDLIILWTVIEHLREPWVDLTKLRALLAPGGWLYLSTMDIRCLRARVEGEKWENYANPTHLFYFDATSLKKTLVTAGFANPQRWHLKFRYPHHGFFRRSLFHVLRLLGLSDGLTFICEKDGAAGISVSSLFVQESQLPSADGIGKVEVQAHGSRFVRRQEDGAL